MDVLALNGMRILVGGDASSGKEVYVRTLEKNIDTAVGAD